MTNNNILEFTGREEISDPLTKRVARQSHHLTGLRDITKFLGQVEKADFMTDDFLVTLQHEGYLLMVLMVSVCTAIKTGNPLFFKERCQIRSELLHVNQQGKSASTGAAT